MTPHSSVLDGGFRGLYSPWGRRESDTPEQLFHTVLGGNVNWYHYCGRQNGVFSKN